MTSSPKTTHTASPALPFHQDHQQSTRSPATRRSARGGAGRNGFWKNVKTQKCAKEQCFFWGGCWSVFCWWDFVLFFLGVVFLVEGIRGEVGFGAFLSGVFSVEGRKLQKRMFQKGSPFRCHVYLFRAMNKEQATTENHVWDVEMLCWGGNFKTVECSRVKREDLSTIFGKGIRNGFCQLDEDSKMIFPWKEMMEITLSIHLHP